MDQSAIERELRRSVPAETTPALDRRVLAAARAEMARRRRGPFRLMSGLAATAAAVLVMVLMREGGDGDPADVPGPYVTESILLGPDTRAARHDDGVMVRRGNALARPSGEPVDVDFPGGTLSVTSGRARVTVWDEDEGAPADEAMREHGIAAAGIVAVLVTIELHTGAARLEIQGEIPRGLEAPAVEHIAFDRDEAGRLRRVHTFSTLEDGAPDLDATPVDPLPRAADVRFRGRVKGEEGDVVPDGAIAKWFTASFPYSFVREQGGRKIPLALRQLPRRFWLPSVVEGATLGAGRGVRVAADGTFELTGPPRNVFGVAVEAPGRLARILRWSPGAGGPAETTFVLRRPRELTVDVRDEHGGGHPVRLPLGRGFLEFSVPDRPSWAIHVPLEPAETDARFRAVLGDDATAALHVISEGYEPFEAEVPASRGAQEMRVDLRRTGYISGVVQDARGRPLANVRVVMEGRDAAPAPGANGSRRSTTTDRGGYFRIAARGGDVTLTLTHEGFAERRVDGLEFNGRDNVVQLEAQESGRVAGTVVRHDGSAFEAHFPLRARRLGGSVHDTLHQWVHPPGRFVFERLVPGRWTLTCLYGVETEVEVSPGRTTEKELRLPALGRIEGSVPEAMRRHQSRIVLWRNDVELGRQPLRKGRFEFPWVPTGDYRIALDGNRQILDVTVAADRTSKVDFQVSSGVVHGTVLRDGRPVIGAILLGDPAQVVPRAAVSKTRADGRFRVERLPPGLLLVRIDDRDGGTMFTTLRAGDGTGNGTSLEWPDGTLRVLWSERAAWPDGWSVSVYVEALGEIRDLQEIPRDLRRLGTVTSASRPRDLSFDGLSEGDYVIVARKGTRTIEMDVRVRGRNTTVTLGRD